MNRGTQDSEISFHPVSFDSANKTFRVDYQEKFFGYVEQINTTRWIFRARVYGYIWVTYGRSRRKAVRAMIRAVHGDDI